MKISNCIFNGMKILDDYAIIFGSAVFRKLILN